MTENVGMFLLGITIFTLACLWAKSLGDYFYEKGAMRILLTLISLPFILVMMVVALIYMVAPFASMFR